MDTECSRLHWNKTPEEESHKVLRPRIFVRGSKGMTTRVEEVGVCDHFVALNG